MAFKRKKPLPRSRRRDFTGDLRFAGANVSRENRAEQISRRDDTVKNVSITLEDIDTAIKFYFDNILKPVVKENERLIKVPTMFGSPERWKSIERDGFFRDEKSKIILPLIMYKRTSTSRDLTIPVDKIDRNIVHTFQKQFTQQNRYDNFSALTNKKPTKERYRVIIPDYVILEYECVAWTSYVSQMNKIVELLQHSSEDYWGDDERFKFYTVIDSLDQSIDITTDTERAVKTSFTLVVKGYLIPEFYNELMNTQKVYTNQQLILDIDADATFVTDEVSEKLAVADTDEIKKLCPDVSDLINLIQLSLGDVKNECFGYLRKVRTFSTILPPSASHSASITEPTFEGRQFVIYNSVETASAPDGIGDETNDDDFLIFVNGQYIEKEAYEIAQSASAFVVQVDSGSLGFNLESDDEVVVWGKFETFPGTLTDTENSLLSLKEKYVAYFRKQSVQFATGSSIISDNGLGESIITFDSVETASAPTDLLQTNEDDFIIFVNGQYIEHDALKVKQTGNDFVVTVCTGSLGFGIETDDEVLAWGRFEEDFTVDFSSINVPICKFPTIYCNYLRLANSFTTLTCPVSNYTTSVVTDDMMGQSIITYTNVFTESAPFDVQPTDKDDFLLFINGQYAEHDAFTIEQNSNNFIITVATGSLGFDLEPDDEIIIWGKFGNRKLLAAAEDVFLIDIEGNFIIDIEQQNIVLDVATPDCPPLI